MREKRGSRSEIFEEADSGAGGFDSCFPTRTADRLFFPWPKLCSRLYPFVFRVLNVSFSIFHLALPGDEVLDVVGVDRQIGDELLR